MIYEKISSFTAVRKNCILHGLFFCNYNYVFQSLLNSLQSELDSLKDSSLHQRRRITDMMMSLLRDLSDIGTIVGGNSAETKVRKTDNYVLRHGPVFKKD